MKTPNYSASKTELILYLQDLNLTDEQINRIVEIAVSMTSNSTKDILLNFSRDIEIMNKYL